MSFFVHIERIHNLRNVYRDALFIHVSESKLKVQLVSAICHILRNARVWQNLAAGWCATSPLHMCLLTLYKAGPATFTLRLPPHSLSFSYLLRSSTSTEACFDQNVFSSVIKLTDSEKPIQKQSTVFFFSSDRLIIMTITKQWWWTDDDNLLRLRDWVRFPIASQ